VKKISDESFDFFEGPWSPPTTCFALKPGVVDFPPRCVGVLHHPGPHGTSAIRVHGMEPFPPIYWDNEDE
jgi:hypothetical protein